MYAVSANVKIFNRVPTLQMVGEVRVRGDWERDGPVHGPVVAAALVWGGYLATWSDAEATRMLLNNPQMNTPSCGKSEQRYESLLNPILLLYFIQLYSKYISFHCLTSYR